MTKEKRALLIRARARKLRLTGEILSFLVSEGEEKPKVDVSDILRTYHATVEPKDQD